MLLINNSSATYTKKMLSFLILCLNTVTFFARASTTEVRVSARKFQNSLNQQNLQTVLMSIEERLRNLDSIYSAQYSPSVEGKLEHYGRKLENVEAKISRLEAVMSNELDKISENISSRNFKDDIGKEHVLRKIDSVYERINSRLVYAEIKLDMAERKLEDKLEMVLSRLERMEDGMSTKDANVEMEFADVMAVMDDIKSTTSTIENKITNLTKLINKTHVHSAAIIQNDQAKLAEKIGDMDAYLADNFNRVRESLNTISLANENFTSDLKRELREEFNMFANKVVDFHDSSWKSYDRMESGLKSVAAVVNTTRYEIQNGFRSLTVQIGRKNGASVLGDSSKDYTILEKLDKKIDSNFESVMLAQNLFLESCYRVQKDESQLETKISEVLERLIDTFEQKTVLQPRDVKNLEQLIRSHDLNARRTSNNVANTVDVLLDKVNANAEKVDENLTLMRNLVEELYLKVQEKLDPDDQDKMDEVISAVKHLQDQLARIEDATRRDSARPDGPTSTEVEEIRKILAQLQNMTTANALETTDIEHIKQYIRDMYHILYSIDLKTSKSYLDYYFNQYNVDQVARRFGKLLDGHVRSCPENITETPVVQNETQSPEEMDRNSLRDQLIREIFGDDINNALLNNTMEKVLMQNTTGTSIPHPFDDGGDFVFETENPKPEASGKRNCSKLPTHAAIDVRFDENVDPNCLETNDTTTAGANNDAMENATRSSYDIDIRILDEPNVETQNRRGGSDRENDSTTETYDLVASGSLEDISDILNATYVEEPTSSDFEDGATEILDYGPGNNEYEYQQEYDGLN